MRQKYPFLSPIGVGLLLILAILLGVDVWRNGGLLFSPGALSAATSGIQAEAVVLSGFKSHADFEKECSRCHQPLQTIQANLCAKCHTRVAAEIASGTGLHSKMDPITKCAGCHPDHAGRGFNIATFALDQFDHAKTSFSLSHHSIRYGGAPMECAACHPQVNLDQAGTRAGYRADPNTCQDCHKQHDAQFMTQHVVDFGTVCLNCHDGKDSMAEFDHIKTNFALDGPHVAVACSGCHKSPNFKDTPTECGHCHTVLPTPKK
jgi:predicted CXXCH cytochrome family protein